MGIRDWIPWGKKAIPALPVIPVPESRAAIIAAAAQHLPWEETPNHTLVIRATVSEQAHLKPLLLASAGAEIIELSHSRSLAAKDGTRDPILVYWAKDPELQAAIREKWKPADRSTDTQHGGMPAVSAQDLIDRGNEKSGPQR